MDSEPRRKRSELRKAAPPAEEPISWEEFPLNGLYCEQCCRNGLAEPQRSVPSGEVCKFGHGNADGLTRSEAGIPDPSAGEDTSPSPAAEEDIPLFEGPDGKPQKAKEPALPPGFNGIITSMHIHDVEDTYRRLRDALKLGDSARNDKGKLREALDTAEDHAREAHLLYCNAVIEAERYTVDAEPVYGAMWNSATEWLECYEHLEDEEEETTEGVKAKRKKAKPRKNITNEDVKAKAAAMYPDQWRRHHSGLKKVKVMVEHMKELADIWSQRCKTLNTLLSTAR